MTDSNYMTNRKVYNRPQAILFSENIGETSNGIYVPSGYEIGSPLNNSGSFITLSDHNRGSLDFGVQRIENRQRMVNGRMRSYWVADKRTLSVSWTMLPSRSYAFKPKFNTPVPISGATYGSSTLVTYTIVLPNTDTLPFVATNVVTIKGIVSAGNTSGADATKFNFATGTVGTITPTVGATTTSYSIPVTVTGASSDTYTSGGVMYLSGTSNPKVGDSAYDSTSLSYTIDGGAGGAELLDWYENHYGTFYVFLAYDKFTEFGKNDAAYEHLNQYQEILEMYITDFTYSVQKRGGTNFDMWDISMTLEEA
jgi:hypothetical protein